MPLTAENLKRNVDRTHFDFKGNERLPHHLRIAHVDNRGTGFDRGHMAPAADHRSCPDTLSDTFFMNNICPQCLQLNRGYWAKLGKHVRELTEDHENVNVVTGPLYLPTIEENGRRFVKYEVIGSNNVSVPHAFLQNNQS